MMAKGIKVRWPGVEGSGETLTAWLDRKPRALLEVVRVFVVVAQRLAAAHAEERVHGTFTADDVRLQGDGRVQVVGFGRERARGDASADQYAVCEALYGCLVPEARTSSGAPRWPNRLPAWLGHAVLRGLAEEPKDRWPSMTALAVALRPPERRGRVALGSALGLGALGLGTLAVAGVRRQPANDCGTVDAHARVLWESSRADRVREGLTGGGEPLGEQTAARVTIAMRDWATAWAREHHARCVADDARATACLQRSEARYVALAEAFADADDGVRRAAVGAVGSLPDPSACAQTQIFVAQPDADEDPELARASARIEADLERARAWLSVGRTPHAQVAVDAALARARDLGHAPVLGTALWLAGATAVRLGEPEAGVRQMEAAHAMLVAAHAPHDAAKVAVSLAATWLDDLARPDLAQTWAVVAEAGYAVHGATAYEWAALHDTRGKIALAESSAELAVTHQERAVRLLRESSQTATPALATAVAHLGRCLLLAGRPDEARRELRRALALSEQAWGPAHPRVADLRDDLAVLP